MLLNQSIVQRGLHRWWIDGYFWRRKEKLEKNQQWKRVGPNHRRISGQLGRKVQRPGSDSTTHRSVSYYFTHSRRWLLLGKRWRRVVLLVALNHSSCHNQICAESDSPPLPLDVVFPFFCLSFGRQAAKYKWKQMRWPYGMLVGVSGESSSSRIYTEAYRQYCMHRSAGPLWMGLIRSRSGAEQSAWKN